MTSYQFRPGSEWWAPHPQHVWTRAVLETGVDTQGKVKLRHSRVLPNGSMTDAKSTQRRRSVTSFSTGDQSDMLTSRIGTAVDEIVEISAALLLPCHDIGETLASVSNMVQLQPVNEASILATIRERFAVDQIYTFVGKVLISVNPYLRLDICNERVLERYAFQTRTERPGEPHIFAIADLSYRAMVFEQEHQSIIISGDSGAGKTEASKMALQYLTQIPYKTRQSRHDDQVLVQNSPSNSPTHSMSPPSIAMKRRLSSCLANVGETMVFLPGDLELRIMESNPLLEAFGNAQTIRNDNSSRFGKYIQLSYTGDGALAGSSISYFLLERSRIVSHSRGERNFHVFYQLLAGAPITQLENLGLKNDAKMYHYLCQGGEQTPEAIARDADLFHYLLRAMDMLSLAPSMIEAIFQILSAILHLGNTAFEQSSSSDSLSPAKLGSESAASIEKFCRQVGIDSKVVRDTLCIREAKAANEVLRIPRDVLDAASTRDALAKAMYARLFHWLMNTINLSLVDGEDGGSTKTDSASTLARKNRRCIGILDIFGFERFPENGFEQLCINYANEKLQGFFVDILCKSEQEIYKEEGLPWTQIAVGNTDERIAFLEAAPVGLFRLLDEESLFPRGTDSSFVQKIAKVHENSPYLQVTPAALRDENKPIFSIVHYAGRVDYCAYGFLAKNKDNVNSQLVDLMLSSKNEHVISILSNDCDDDTSAPRNVREMEATIGGSNRRAKSKFVAQRFRSQLQELVETLLKAQPYFIRCIKPNDSMKSRIFQSVLVSEQLINAGILQLVQIRKQGFPRRFTFRQFMKRYAIVLRGHPDEKKVAAMESRQAVDVVLSCVPDRAKATGVIDPSNVQYQIGKRRVFLRDECVEWLDFRLDEVLSISAVVIQRYARGHLARIKLRARISAHVIQTSCRMYLQVVEYKKKLEAYKKRLAEEEERRRKEELARLEELERIEAEKLAEAKRLRDAATADKIRKEMEERQRAAEAESNLRKEREALLETQRRLESIAIAASSAGPVGNVADSTIGLPAGMSPLSATATHSSINDNGSAENMPIESHAFSWGNIDGIELTSITRQVVAAIFTKPDVEAVMKEFVEKVLERHHPESYRIYNLCAEEVYDVNLFPDKVSRYPFLGHSPCAFKKIPRFCTDLNRWVSQGENCVAIVHSKAGKGRASVMLCSYLLYCSLCQTPREAMLRFWSLREHALDMSMTPSQRRYVDYFHRYLQVRLSRNVPTGQSDKLVPIPSRGQAVAALSAIKVCKLTTTLVPDCQQVWAMISLGIGSRARQKWIRVTERTAVDCIWRFSSPIRVRDDVKIEVLKRNRQSKTAKVLFYFCFNTRFLEGSACRYTKKELDKAFKDTQHNIYHEDLCIELDYSIEISEETLPENLSKPDRIKKYSDDDKGGDDDGILESTG